MLNPKVAIFYLSLFPYFIKPEYGSVFLQSIQLGLTQVIISASINFLIVLSASQVARFFANNPTWVKVQKWVMAAVLVGMTIKMDLSAAA